MNKSEYQMLRFTIENQIADFNDGLLDTAALANSIMRSFLSAISTEQVKRQISKRELLTFRRDKQVTVPGWAFHPTGRK